ncbi:DUF2243 domain-containing protein [Natronococcus pandeyae]|uniref:DUF2243 domain-containing protein n=1 Tax=Natronococcus pandeyae TaxID=2055836 RepID=A0A8J8TRB8_9EURY|nr:DUF2243 domain-containing protein [Natronococcus pandeyae]TYL37402.1 DUF2243 domain-containing protein [Natronococcus pandeyae]
MSAQSERWFGLRKTAKPLVQAGVVLGIGLGGFFDGIVLHQLLQTHHMLSARTDTTDLGQLQLNVLADGLFHVGTLLFTIAGIVLLVRAWRRSDVPPSYRTLVGSVFVGWGSFNLVEGVVNHHLLELHRVWPDGPGGALVWDVGFLLSGVVFLVGGYVVVRTDEAVAPSSHGGNETTDSEHVDTTDSRSE